MKLCLIAGEGQLPQIIEKSIKNKGVDYCVILINASNNKNFAAKSYKINMPDVDGLLKILKAEHCTHLVFAGKMHKPKNFNALNLGVKGLKLLARIAKSKLFGDDSLLKIVMKFFEDENYQIVAPHEIVPNLLLKKNCYSKLKPKKEDLADIEIGASFLAKISEFDVGQAVVIANKMIIAVEGLEGTDAMLKRATALKNSNSGILVKFKKIGQDERSDLPAIGPETIEHLRKGSYKGLAIEAEKTIVIDFEEVVKLVDNYGIFFIAL